MKSLKNILTIIIFVLIIMVIPIEIQKKAISANSNVTSGEPVKVGVLLYRFDDPYVSEIRKNLEEIQKESDGKVEFTFFDGKGDQTIQNQSLDALLSQKQVDLILLNLVDTKVTQTAINKIKENNIPVILFNREPVVIDAVKSYRKAYFVGTNAKEAGILQGNILVDLWNNDKASIDKNKDNILQYVMLAGDRDNIEAGERTKYSVLTINNAGIKTEELALRVANFDREQAKKATESLFLRYGSGIEAIIANNDAMAIGAIEALQEQDYNKGDKTKTIPVVGIDAIPEAQDLIKKGFMTGSVLQDAPAMTEAMYTVGMNLISGKEPLDGTQYKFDDTEVSIRIPYQEYQ